MFCYEMSTPRYGTCAYSALKASFYSPLQGPLCNKRALICLARAAKSVIEGGELVIDAVSRRLLGRTSENWSWWAECRTGVSSDFGWALFTTYIAFPVV